MCVENEKREGIRYSSRRKNATRSRLTFHSANRKGKASTRAHGAVHGCCRQSEIGSSQRKGEGVGNRKQLICIGWGVWVARTQRMLSLHPESWVLIGWCVIQMMSGIEILFGETSSFHI